MQRKIYYNWKLLIKSSKNNNNNIKKRNSKCTINYIIYNFFVHFSIHKFIIMKLI